MFKHRPSIQVDVEVLDQLDELLGALDVLRVNDTSLAVIAGRLYFILLCKNWAKKFGAELEGGVSTKYSVIFSNSPAGKPITLILADFKWRGSWIGSLEFDSNCALLYNRCPQPYHAKRPLQPHELWEEVFKPCLEAVKAETRAELNMLSRLTKTTP